VVYGIGILYVVIFYNKVHTPKTARKNTHKRAHVHTTKLLYRYVFTIYILVYHILWEQ
jgi:hypothetical protein